MGLEMFIYKITPPSGPEKELLKTREIEGICPYSIPSLRRDPELADLWGRFKKEPTSKVLEQFWNMDALKRAYKLGEEDYLYGSYTDENGTTTFYFNGEHGDIQIQIPRSVRELYLNKDYYNAIYLKLEECANLGKNEELQRAFHEALGKEILNCGYYALDEETLKGL